MTGNDWKFELPQIVQCQILSIAPFPDFYELWRVSKQTIPARREHFKVERLRNSLKRFRFDRFSAFAMGLQKPSRIGAKEYPREV